jgi:hypothetical protein
VIYHFPLPFLYHKLRGLHAADPGHPALFLVFCFGVCSRKVGQTRFELRKLPLLSAEMECTPKQARLGSLPFSYLNITAAATVSVSLIGGSSRPFHPITKGQVVDR